MRVLGTLLVTTVMFAADWPMFSHDPQRSGWARGETEINKDTVKQFKKLWEVKVDNAPRGLQNLTAAIFVQKVIRGSNFVDLAIVAGTENNVYAIDADSGKMVWQRRLPIEGTPRPYPVAWLCHGGLNATPAFDRATGALYVLGADGRLWSLQAASGADKVPPAQFIPAFAKMWSLNVRDGVVYSATSQGCNGVKSAVYAMDVRDPKRPVAVLQASTSGAGIWGRAGVAIDSKGLVHAETGDGPYDPATGKYSDTFLALKPRTVEVADYYTPLNRAYITRKDLDMGNISPIVFDLKGKELIAGSGKEGVLYLLDAAKLGGEDHRTPLYRVQWTNEDAAFAGKGFWGAFATWEDDSGTRWLYAPAWGPQYSKSPKFPVAHDDTPDGSLMAFKVVEKDGKAAIEPAWRSRNLAYPDPPVIAGGVVFSLNTGDNVEQADENGKILDVAARIKMRKGIAVLYAFDAQTGKDLWNSGTAMPGFTHFAGLAIGNGKVFVTTYDGMIYAFGTGDTNL